MAKNIAIYCPDVGKMAGNGTGSYEGNQEVDHSPGYCFALRLLACTLALCVVFVVGLAPARAVSAGATITVAGGTIGTGAMATGAGLASVALPVLGIVGVALLACGVDVALTNVSAEAGMTKTEFIRAKLGEFAEARGQDVNHLINLMSNHLAVMSDGSIVVGQEAGEVIQQFGNWLYAEDMVIDMPISTNPDMMLGSYPCYLINGSIETKLRDFFQVQSGNASDVYLVAFNYSGKSFEFTLFSDSVFNSQQYTTNSVGAVAWHSGYVTAQKTGNHYFQSYTYSVPNISDIYLNYTVGSTPSRTQLDALISGTGVTGGSTDIGEDVFTGAEQNWTDNNDLLIPGSGEATIVTGPDVINPAATAVATGDYTISVPDYLDALARAYNAGADAAMDIALTNTATGVATDVPITGVDGATSAISQTASSAATAAATPVAAAGAALDAGDAVQLLQFPLTEIFPFCVVFDAYDMLSILRADPVVPQFTFSWPIPYMTDPITVNVDLSMFDTLATVVRYCELFLFVLGLALSTRDLIKG